MSEIGLLRRLFIIYVKSEELKNWKPPLKRDTDEILNELEELGNRIGKRMYELYKRTYGEEELLPIQYTPEAQKKINKFAEDIDKQVRLNDDNLPS